MDTDTEELVMLTTRMKINMFEQQRHDMSTGKATGRRIAETLNSNR